VSVVNKLFKQSLIALYLFSECQWTWKNNGAGGLLPRIAAELMRMAETASSIL
jgi:hypothetical protein